MFSNLLIALLFSIGFSGWVFAKTHKTTGGNTKSALTVAGASGLAAFVLAWLILGTIF